MERRVEPVDQPLFFFYFGHFHDCHDCHDIFMISYSNLFDSNYSTLAWWCTTAVLEVAHDYPYVRATT
jgi:hypothetical protein